MKRAALITGCNGGIGAALVKAFAAASWHVVGVDRVPAKTGGGVDFINADLGELSRDEKKLAAFADDARKAFAGAPLGVIVNNAAIQELGSVNDLSLDLFIETMNVNLIAPFALVKTFLPDLEAARGSVVNIGSVHAQATKPGFAAYATSKAALHGLTRALAVDLGPRVRVNTLAPAAVSTDMLKAGFDGEPEAFAALENIHPAGRIATPEEIAKIAVFLASEDAGFMTGATVYADGGILSRLHDPA